MVDWLLTQNVFVMAYDVINTEKDKQQVKEHGSLLPRPIWSYILLIYDDNRFTFKLTFTL